MTRQPEAAFNGDRRNSRKRLRTAAQWRSSLLGYAVGQRKVPRKSCAVEEIGLRSRKCGMRSPRNRSLRNGKSSRKKEESGGPASSSLPHLSANSAQAMRPAHTALSPSRPAKNLNIRLVFSSLFLHYYWQERRCRVVGDPRAQVFPGDIGIKSNCVELPHHPLHPPVRRYVDVYPHFYDIPGRFDLRSPGSNAVRMKRRATGLFAHAGSVSLNLII